MEAEQLVSSIGAGVVLLVIAVLLPVLLVIAVLPVELVCVSMDTGLTFLNHLSVFELTE